MTPTRSLQSFLAYLCLGFGVALAPAGDEGRFIADQIDQANYRHILEDLLFTHTGDNRGAGSPQHLAARENIEAEFASYGLPVELHVFQIAGRDWANVVATQVGTVHPDALYIIGAHYDSANNPGADDNGSGTAALLEIARVLSRYESDYTIRYIAFDREERGLDGSEAYVSDYSTDDVRGMISIDMIAYKSGAGRAHIYGMSASTPIKEALRDAIVEYGGLQVVLQGSMSGSDHAPFEAAGYQACLLIERLFSNPCYHGACDAVDTPDYLDYDYALSMTRGVAGWLVDHAGVQVCVGDLNGDDAVTTEDLALLLANYGGAGPGNPGDVDGDGDCDLADLSYVLSHYGAVCG